MSSASVLADRGLLAALAIAFDQAGIRDRPSKLAAAAMYVGRPVTSTSHLTAEEARELRKRLRSGDAFAGLLQVVDERRQDTEAVAAARESGCGPDGRHVVPDGDGVRSCPCGAVTRHPRGRYCPPKVCWCGSCSWWTPMPPVNYAAAVARLQELSQRGAR